MFEKEKIANFGKSANLAGILHVSKKAEASTANPAVVILNAGLIHKVGPNRIFVEMARQLSDIGLNVMRFDFSGIGDSSKRDDAESFEKAAENEVSEAFNYIQQKLGNKKYILIGLCSGAIASLNIGAKDNRVIAAVIINIPPPDTYVGKEMSSASFYFENALFSANSWKKMVLGKSEYRKIASAIKFAVLLKLKKLFNINIERNHGGIELKKKIRNFIEGKKKILFISTDEEVGAEYIFRVAKKEIRQLRKNKLLNVSYFHGSDHLFTLVKHQTLLQKEIINWVKHCVFGVL